MHTEEQAKTKWCPETRVYHSHVAVNTADAARSPDIVEATRCQASGCMHWRWMIAGGGITYEQEINDGPDAPPRGFCGLSGRPAL